MGGRDDLPEVVQSVSEDEVVGTDIGARGGAGLGKPEDGGGKGVGGQATEGIPEEAAERRDLTDLLGSRGLVEVGAALVVGQGSGLGGQPARIEERGGAVRHRTSRCMGG